MVGLGLRTQFDFLLPMGFVDDDGVLHRRGVMRLATARDEIEPLRDPRVAQNDAYLTVLVLSRVVTSIGDISEVTPTVIEGLFAADLAYLQDFYGIANFGDQSELLIDLDVMEQQDPAASGSDTSEAAVVDDAEMAAVEELPRPRPPTVEEIPQSDATLQVMEA